MGWPRETAGEGRPSDHCLPTAQPYKVPLVLWAEWLCVWEKNSFLRRPYAPRGWNRPLLFTRGWCLLSGRFLFVLGVLTPGALVPPGPSEEVGSQGAGKGRFAARPLGCNKTWEQGCPWGAHCGQQGKSQIGTHIQDCVVHPKRQSRPTAQGGLRWASAVQGHFLLLSVVMGSQLGSDLYIFLGIVTAIL